MNRSIGLGVIGCVLVIVTSGCETMAGRWEQASKADTVQNYQQFLRDYPSGRFADEALKRIELLNYQEAARKVAQAPPSSPPTPTPNGERSNSARDRSKSFTKEEDDKAFKLAEQWNSVNSYQSFIYTHPDSPHKQVAMDRLAPLIEAERAQTERERATPGIVKELIRAQIQRELKVATGDSAFVGERFVPVYSTKQPASGNVFVVVGIRIRPTGSSWQISKNDIECASAKSSYQPFSWYRDMIFIQQTGEHFNVSEESRFVAQFEIPAKEIHTLELKVQGDRVASLSYLETDVQDLVIPPKALSAPRKKAPNAKQKSAESK